MFYFLFFFQKAENNRFKNNQLPKVLWYYFFCFCLIVGPVDQQINLVSPRIDIVKFFTV